jgi:hypothetical protein
MLTRIRKNFTKNVVLSQNQTPRRPSRPAISFIDSFRTTKKTRTPQLLWRIKKPNLPDSTSKMVRGKLFFCPVQWIFLPLRTHLLAPLPLIMWPFLPLYLPNSWVLGSPLLGCHLRSPPPGRLFNRGRYHLRHLPLPVRVRGR